MVNQLKQKPHNIPQYEGGDQVPVDDVSKTPYAPVPQVRHVLLSHFHRVRHSIHIMARSGTQWILTVL